MSAPIVTGAQIFRAKKTLSPAEIFALETTPVLIAPKVPLKTLQIIAVFARSVFGTVEFDFTGHASLYYGSLNSGISPIGAQDIANKMLNQQTTSAIAANIAPVTLPAYAMGNPANTDDKDLYLVKTSGTFHAGSATAATVDPANKGLLYALGDTGNITDGDGTAVYTVTGVGAGGLVTTVTVSGGNGLVTGASFATTVLTGSGDGTLKLAITSITPLGDGTLEIDVIYTPI